MAEGVKYCLSEGCLCLPCRTGEFQHRGISETNFLAKARASTNHTDVFGFLWNNINKTNVGQFYCFCTCAECVKFQKGFSRIRKSVKATKVVSQKGRPPEGTNQNWLESFSLQKETTEEECDNRGLQYPEGHIEEWIRN